MCNIEIEQKLNLRRNKKLRNENIEIPKLNFDSNGELIIIQSTNSSNNDFDFYEGKRI